MRNIRLIILCLPGFLFYASLSVAQPKTPALTFEEIYDDPYGINKLFVSFQPFYGELFATNVNAGFGLEAHYFHTNKFDAKAQFRKSYSSKFFDFNRELAIKNSLMENEPAIFNYFEIGGTYHIKDFDVQSTTSVFLYKKKFSANRWASTVPLHAEVPARLRKIFGVRAGAAFWKSTADISRALEAQGLRNADLVTTGNVPLPDTYVDENGETQNLAVFSNISSANLYIGASITRIHNMAVGFNNYDEGFDDGILTLFMDVMFAPSLTLDPVLYNQNEYSVQAIKLNTIGFRVGIDGKFNREKGWAYGGEMGYRPSIDGRGYFALIKIAFPVLGTKLEHKVDAYGK
jgi:hypothetical protein